jgi:hypothetical protein
LQIDNQELLEAGCAFLTSTAKFGTKFVVEKSKKFHTPPLHSKTYRMNQPVFSKTDQKQIR